MTFKEYLPLANRTLKPLGSKVNDSVHMALGMAEIGEIEAAFNEPKLDIVNLNEELGDLMWYLANYAIIHNININAVNLNDGHIDSGAFSKLIISTQKLVDINKRWFAYSKEPDTSKNEEIYFDVIRAMRTMFIVYNIDPSDCMERNINKLRVRFPDKYSDNYAINRNTEAERKTLEE